MKVVLQRVKTASVTVSGDEVSSIGRGFLLLVGMGKNDAFGEVKIMAKKIESFRIFEDAEGKMNLNISQAGGEVLSVPQFTLLADTKKGNRPGFDGAMEPEKAKDLWHKFNEELISLGVRVEGGIFGAHMEINLVNDGPVTFVLET